MAEISELVDLYRRHANDVRTAKRRLSKLGRVPVRGTPEYDQTLGMQSRAEHWMDQYAHHVMRKLVRELSVREFPEVRR